MREIKFRAWNGQYMINSEYGDWVSFDGVIYKEADKTFNTPNIEIENNKSKPLLMQFTGLKDTEGKDIYEDDVCEVRINIHGKPSDEKFKAGIKYNENIGAFQIKYRCMAGGFCTDNLGSYFLKVIGNVHKNPELLGL
jgi:uncharacterized phage protein (TIGR01671 family)